MQTEFEFEILSLFAFFSSISLPLLLGWLNLTAQRENRISFSLHEGELQPNEVGNYARKTRKTPKRYSA